MHYTKVLVHLCCMYVCILAWIYVEGAVSGIEELSWHTDMVRAECDVFLPLPV